MSKETRGLEAVLGALLREWASTARRGSRSGRSVVVDEIGHRAYHQEMARTGDRKEAKRQAGEARDVARQLIGLPSSDDRKLEDLAERRGL